MTSAKLQTTSQQINGNLLHFTGKTFFPRLVNYKWVDDTVLPWSQLNAHRSCFRWTQPGPECLLKYAIKPPGFVLKFGDNGFCENKRKKHVIH